MSDETCVSPSLAFLIFCLCCMQLHTAGDREIDMALLTNALGMEFRDVANGIFQLQVGDVGLLLLVHRILSLLPAL